MPEQAIPDEPAVTSDARATSHDYFLACVDPFCRMFHPASCGLEQCTDDHSANSRDVVNFIGNAPISARLRNELVRRSYADFSNHLAALIFGDDPDDVADVVPNFFSYAHWGAYTVGRFLRAPWRWLPTGRAVGAELEDGNADIHYAMASRAARFFAEVDPTFEQDAPRFVRDEPELAGSSIPFSESVLSTEEHGIPQSVLAGLDLPNEPTLGDVTTALRDRGFELYKQAIPRPSEGYEPSIAERQLFVVRGNAWLVLSEQAAANIPLAVAMRISPRRVLSGRSLVTSSARVWQSERPGALRLAIENLWMVVFSSLMVFRHPWGVLSSGTKTLGVRWFKRQRRQGLRPRFAALEQPFSLIDPDVRFDAWLEYPDRIAALFAFLENSHRAATTPRRGLARALPRRGWFKNYWFGKSDARGRRFYLREPRAWRHARSQMRRLNVRLGQCRGAPVRSAVANATRAPRSSLQHASAGAQPDVGVWCASAGDWAHAGQVWRDERMHSRICIALFTRSFPAGYCSPTRCDVLDPSSWRPADDQLLNTASMRPESPAAHEAAMIGDSFWRVGQTITFIDRLLIPGERPEAGSAASKALADSVRTQETRAASLSPAMPYAMNQHQQLGATCSFIVPIYKMFQELNLDPKGVICWDAWARVWFDIGVALGLDPKTVQSRLSLRDGTNPEESWVRTMADAEHLNHTVLLDEYEYRSLGGVRLLHDLVNDAADSVPRFASPLVVIGLNLLGDRNHHDLLLYPQSRLRHLRWIVGKSPSVKWRIVDPLMRSFVVTAQSSRQQVDTAMLYPQHLAQSLADAAPFEKEAAS